MSDGSAFAGALLFNGITGPAASTAPLASPTPGYYPNFANTLANLLAQYNALPATLQAEYNGIVGSDFIATGGINYDIPANNGNQQPKVNLVALLAAYAGLSPTLQMQFDATVSSNQGLYNNDPAGVLNKLSLIQSYFVPPAGAPATYAPNFTNSLANLLVQYNALPPDLQAEYNGIVGTDFIATGGINYDIPADNGNQQPKVNLAVLLLSYSYLSIGSKDAL